MKRDKNANMIMINDYDGDDDGNDDDISTHCAAKSNKTSSTNSFEIYPLFSNNDI